MDLSGYLAILRRHWLPVVASVAIALVIAVAITATAPKRYRATTTMFVNLPAATDVREALQGVELSAQLLESYADIATSRSSAAEIAEALDSEVTAGEVRARLSAEPRPDTVLLDLSVLDTDRDRARRTADAAATVLADKIRDLGPTPERAVEARVLDAAVVGADPVTPRPVRNAATALALGLGFGIAFAFVLESLGRPAPAPVAAPVAGRSEEGEVVRLLASVDARLDSLEAAVSASRAAPARSRRTRPAEDKPTN